MMPDLSSSEAEWSEWLASTLTMCGADVVTEVEARGARIDVVVTAEFTTAVEIKRCDPSKDSRNLCTALGQALTYRAAGYERVAVAIPWTRYIPGRILDAYERAGVQIVEMSVTGYTLLQPAFPYLYGSPTGMPWGRVLHPHAHIGAIVSNNAIKGE